MRAPLRWVLWDVLDTLLKVRLSVGEQYCREAKRWGLNFSTVDVEIAFRRAYLRHSSTYPNYGANQGMDGQSWWMGVVRDTFSQCKVHDKVLLNTMAHNLYYGFCNADNWEVFPDSKAALEGCSSLGLKLAVVSNFDNRLETILSACELLPYFSFLVTSEDARVAKPNPAIFDLALLKCGVPASSVAHVGDHYVKDYLSSCRVGIQGVLLDRHNKESQSEVPRQHRLTSLEELPSWIRRHMESCD